MRKLKSDEVRALRRLCASGRWEPRKGLITYLGRVSGALDRVVRLGLAEERKDRLGQRGPARRSVRITQQGVLALGAAIRPEEAPTADPPPASAARARRKAPPSRKAKARRRVR